MADFSFPKTAITFTFSVNPNELEQLAHDVKTIMSLPDSRPAPEAQPEGYTHVIANSLSPTTRKLFEMLEAYAPNEDKRERTLKRRLSPPNADQ